MNHQTPRFRSSLAAIVQVLGVLTLVNCTDASAPLMQGGGGGDDDGGGAGSLAGGQSGGHGTDGSQASGGDQGVSGGGGEGHGAAGFVAPFLCSQFLTASGSDPRVHDFEGLIPNDFLPLESQGEVPLKFTSARLVSEDETDDDQFALVEGWGDGSLQALAVTAEALEPPESLSGSGLAFAFFTSGSECVDASAYDGISFWAKIVEPAGFDVRFYVQSLDSSKDADGSYCYSRCPQFYTNLSLTDEWQQFDVEWSDFDDGDSSEFDLTIKSFIFWVTNTTDSPSDLELVVDDIEFLGGDPLPSGGSGGAASSGGSFSAGGGD
jgi:hypothetical protein